MTLRQGEKSASPESPSPAAGRWQALLVRDASLVQVALLSAPLVGAGIWLLASPDRLVSREMTWDLLFNLSGAWHLYVGHTAHIDFHDPIGRLNFWLTEVGFWVLGPSVFAVVVGKVLAAVAIFAAATLACARRLPLLPAIVFVVFVCQLVLKPINIGDEPTDYSFAMSYNLYGWAALCTLSLILFVPPRREDGGWLDAAIGGGLIVAMFYLKLTYFVAAVGALAVAGVVSAHVRAQQVAWLVAAAVIAANVLAPFNSAYLGDFLAAAREGSARSNTIDLIIRLMLNVPELSLYAAALMITATLWWLGRAPLRLPVGVCLLTAIGIAVMSQNEQTAGIGVGVVIAILLFDHVRNAKPADWRYGVAWLLALLALPTALTVRSAAVLAGYHINATRGSALFVVDRTNLKDLAVPTYDAGLLDAFASEQVEQGLLNRSRSIDSRHELPPYVYVQTILEAADLLDGAPDRQGGVVLVDQVNPLPFVLGWLPPRGGNLWSGPGLPMQPADRLFADVAYVLVPKFPTNAVASELLLDVYGDYIVSNFATRTETRSWIAYSREIDG